MTDHRGPIPVPARITDALDMIGAYGPWVDEALGGAEPMVDEWEAGHRLPTPAQVEKLAELTRLPPAYFYKPVEDWETEPARTFICNRARRGENGLTIIRSWIDWEGVRHTEQETPDRPPYRPKKQASGLSNVDRAENIPTKTPAKPPTRPNAQHPPTEDPETPGHCLTCQLPLDAPNWRHRRPR